MWGDKFTIRTVGDGACSPIDLKEALHPLPVPHGAVEYAGWVHMPDFGRHRLRLRVMRRELGTLIGEWQVGSQRERVHIEFLDVSTLQIHNVEGKHLTRYFVNVQRCGILSGSVTQDGQRGGHVKLWPMGENRSQLRELYVKVLSGYCNKKVKPLDHPEELQGNCAICLEDYSHGDMVSQTHCGHTFHYGCLQEWLESQNTCPMCRSAIAAPRATPAELELRATMGMMAAIAR